MLNIGFVLEKKAAARRTPAHEMWFAQKDTVPKNITPNQKFTITYNDLHFGDEHIQIKKTPDDREKITSIVAMHGLSPVHFQVDVEVCHKGTLCSLEIKSLSKHDDTYISQDFDLIG